MKRELRTTIQTSKCGRFCLQRCRHFRELDAFCGYTAQFLDVHTAEGRILRHSKCLRDEVTP